MIRSRIAETKCVSQPPDYRSPSLFCRWWRYLSSAFFPLGNWCVGQAIDRWKAEVKPDFDRLRSEYHPVQHHRTNYMINRKYMRNEEDYCAPQLFKMANDFLCKNHGVIAGYYSLSVLTRMNRFTRHLDFENFIQQIITDQFWTGQFMTVSPKRQKKLPNFGLIIRRLLR